MGMSGRLKGELKNEDLDSDRPTDKNIRFSWIWDRG